ncbi:MAG: type I-E CRISPR-associated protein Cas7/Cse4/CasC, partial [Calditrichaeota bacterium]
MDLIELHILQSFPVTCLNRDDVGAPKTAMFGGVQRARVSSQSWKRAIRFLAKTYQEPFFGATRTRFVIRALRRLYEERGLGDTEAQEMAIATADALGKIDKVEKGNVKTLLFFSPQELQQVVAAALNSDYRKPLQAILAAGDSEKKLKAARSELAKALKKARKELATAVKDAADIAVFGRMVADDHTLMVEGAGLFSHALSTHRASNEVEFFSAVDDNAEPGDEGAGHIGTLEFSSACYYRYVGLNLDLLRDERHLAHFTDEEFRSVVEAFLKAALMAVPQARKNSMFGHTVPS